MAENRKHLDFEIVKEPWNKYSLKDGSKLKTRVMLESAWSITANKKKEYRANLKNFTVILCDPSLQGPKNQTKFTKEQILKNIEVPNCKYDTTSYEANEYILDDMTRILIHTNITQISRTKLHDANGDRIYSIGFQATTTVTPSPQ